jgi:hypothetical protein
MCRLNYGLISNYRVTSEPFPKTWEPINVVWECTATINSWSNAVIDANHVTCKEIEQRMDELAREYHETHDPEIV